MCADRSCPARGACVRYLSRPAANQVYLDYGARRKAAGGDCPDFVAVKPWKSGLYRIATVRDRYTVDIENSLADNAKLLKETA